MKNVAPTLNINKTKNLINPNESKNQASITKLATDEKMEKILQTDRVMQPSLWTKSENINNHA